MAGDTIGAGRGTRWTLVIWAGAALLLLLPLVAMQFTHEVNWGPVDFATFGAMLVTACGACELAVRASDSLVYRAGAAAAIGTAFFLVWANLAVGFIGDEDNPANLMYAGVLAIAIVGAALAHARPRGMARAMVATALAQAAAGLIALVAGWGEAIPQTVGFVALWLASAWLFRKAA